MEKKYLPLKANDKDVINLCNCVNVSFPFSFIIQKLYKHTVKQHSYIQKSYSIDMKFRMCITPHILTYTLLSIPYVFLLNANINYAVVIFFSLLFLLVGRFFYMLCLLVNFRCGVFFIKTDWVRFEWELKLTMERAIFAFSCFCVLLVVVLVYIYIYIRL